MHVFCCFLGGEARGGGYGPFKNIFLISSRSFIKGEGTPENPGKKTPDQPSAELGFPTCDLSKTRSTAVRNLIDCQLSYPLGYGVTQMHTYTLQPLYNTIRYSMVLDVTQFQDEAQKCIDYIEK